MLCRKTGGALNALKVTKQTESSADPIPMPLGTPGCLVPKKIDSVDNYLASYQLMEASLNNSAEWKHFVNSPAYCADYQLKVRP